MTEPSTPIDTQPDQLAERLAPLIGTAIFGFDVDGVLAPIVAHANDSRLSPGVADSIATLAERTPVAVVSGRSVESLERLFGFPPSVTVIGSHGAEHRGQPERPLDDDERYTFDQLELLGTKTVEAIGEGAWLERKPTGVVVHTRTADPAAVTEPVAILTRLAGMVDGAVIKPGSHVIEMMARRADKGTALVELAATLGVPVGAYFGDDVTDEDAFAALDGDAVTVKVGDGATAARYRLADPAAVAETLELLTNP